MKIALLGDSITAGLGSKKINFTEELKKILGNCQVDNLALTGTTIKYINKELHVDYSKYDYIIVLYGNVDAQIRPNRDGRIFKILPKRFKEGNGSMILPRPFYSSNFLKKIFQIFENNIRTLIRKTIYLVDGTEQWVSLSEFQKNYIEFIEKIDCKNKLILCSTFYIDEKLFPGTNEEYIKYNKTIKEIAKIYNFKYISFYDLFKNIVDQYGWKFIYNHDHFHPNGNGYKIIASEISHILMKEF